MSPATTLHPPFTTPQPSPARGRRGWGIVGLVSCLALSTAGLSLGTPAEAATLTLSPGQAKRANTVATAAESGAVVTFKVPSLRKGAVIVADELRRSGSTSYRTRVTVFANGTMRVGIVRARNDRETTLSSVDLATKATAGQTVRLEGSVSGSRAVVVKVRASLAGSATPGWQRQVVDRSANRIVSPGKAGVWSYLSTATPRRTGVVIRSFAANARPVVPTTSTAGATVSGRTATVRFASDVPDATFRCSLNGRPLNGCVSPMMLTGLPTGRSQFKVRAVSSFGRSDRSATVVSFAVGVPAPVTEKKPTAATTGVPAGTRLRVHQGTIVVTKAGTVLNGLDVRGFVVVKAANVTIKNSIIRGGSTRGNIGLITNYGYRNLQVRDTTLQATKQSVWVDGLKGWNFTARRVHIVGNVDSVKIHGDNVVLADSLLENTVKFAHDPNQRGGATHNDNVQILNGDHITIARNTIRGATNFAILGAANKGDVSDLTIRDNWVDGGHCTVKLQIIDNRSLRASVTDNKFGPNREVSYCPMQVEPKVQLAATGNVYEGSATPVAIYRGR